MLEDIEIPDINWDSTQPGFFTQLVPIPLWMIIVAGLTILHATINMDKKNANTKSLNPGNAAVVQPYLGTTTLSWNNMYLWATIGFVVVYLWISPKKMFSDF